MTDQAKTPHSYAQVLRWIADGEQIQWWDGKGEWLDWSGKPILQEINAGMFEPSRYRIAPPKDRTIMVNGFEVLAGEVEAPARGARWYHAAVDSEEWCCGPFRWLDSNWGNCYLQRGLLYLDKDAAIARAKAMLGIDPKS